ncbi:MAG: hypothetical protein PHS57_03365 [Alphaproteobacteria bacterium]|nr:hypothetical protein [Alphaproteobacteria bacterium]
MTILSSQDVEAQVRPETGTGGPVAGLDIHYNIDPTTDVSSPVGMVDIKLDEKSLVQAEKKTGVTRTPKKGHAPTVSESMTNKQRHSDDMYASMFDKKGLSARVGLAGGPNYRKALSPAPVGPLARVRQRRLLELRRTFDQIAAMKNKKVAVNAENLPQEVMRKMVKEAFAKGEKTTPFGSIAQAAKRVGLKPSKKERQWALFVNPELIPSGWAMD